MSAPLWYLLVIVGGALFGYGSGWVFDLVARRRWRRELTVEKFINPRDDDRGA